MGRSFDPDDPQTAHTIDDLEVSADLRSLLHDLAHAPSWPRAQRATIAPGDQIGRYTLERVIGQGGFGVVFAALDETLGRRVAIKMTRGEPTAQALARFEHEARMAASVNHPGLVTLHDSGTIAGLPYLVLELLDGETLAARLVRAPLTIDQALATMADVLDAVARMHAAGIVHLDLKPANVFVTREGPVKVLDFGLAKLRGRGVAAGGTRGYMAPEQVRGDETDARGDVYAVGVMLLELTSGQHRDPPDPRLAPLRVRGVVARALAVEPAERFAHAGELAEAVRALRFPNRRTRRRVGLAVGAAVLAAAVLVPIGVTLRDQRTVVRAAALAERAGRVASSIEAELRYARLQPPHDLRPDEQRARRTLEALAREVASAGRDGGDSAEIALARAERALHDLPAARHRLEAVIERERTPAAVSALGEVLLDQYADGLLEAADTVDPEQRAATARQLARALRDPGLRDLHEGGVSSPLLLARIAVFESRFDDARQIANQVLANDPGRYEADALIGDSYVYPLHTSNAGPDEIVAATGQAGAAYAAAIAIARSDPRLLESECDRRGLDYEAREHRGEELAAQLAAAREACRTALLARPADPATTNHLAMLLYNHAVRVAEHGDDPRAILAEAATAVDEARAAHPEAHVLAQSRGMLAVAEAYAVSSRGGDPRPSYAAAERSFEEARRLKPDGDAGDRLGTVAVLRAEDALARGDDPSPAVARALDLIRDREHVAWLSWTGRALVARATWQTDHGIDPRSSLDAAIAGFAKSRRIRPTSPEAADEEGAAWEARAQWEQRTGGDGIASLDRAIACTQAMLAIDPNNLNGHTNLGEELTGRAAAEHARGGDPHPLLRRAVEHLERARVIDPQSDAPLVNLAIAHEVEARWALAAGRDAAPAMAAARRALAEARALQDESQDRSTLRTECALARDEVARSLRAGRSPGPALAVARLACERVVAQADHDPEVCQLYADLLRELAAWKQAQRLDASAELAEGLRRIRVTRAVNPRSAEAIAIEASLIQLGAR